jgi:hypothetical protein
VKEMAQSLIEHVSSFAGDYLISIIILTFLGSVLLRALIYFTVKRHEWFAKEFEKRVDRYIDQDKGAGSPVSFYVLAKKILENTYYENFENRAKFKRRKPDRIMDLSDRIFLIKQGSAWIVKDTLKQLKHLKYSYQQPKILNVTKSVFKSNPCFNRILGLIPMATVNDVLNILPGLFVIGGIFGTFLGIMKGLPELSGMNLSDLEQTKLVMDGFLANIAFSMTTSIVGIMCSVGMSMVNTVWSPEKLFVAIIDRFENALDILWNRSDNNDIPVVGIDFNEHRDPSEAVAEAALQQEIEKKHRVRELDKLNNKKVS